MGSVVPFPVHRAQGDPRVLRTAPGAPCEIVILQVVQFVRPASPVAIAE